MTLRAASPTVPPPTYQGDLIASLEHVVEERVEAADSSASVRSGPVLIAKREGRNYFRLTELPQVDSETPIPCSTTDCQNPARLMLDTRDEAIRAHCEKCAYVEFAMWMVGV